MSISYSYGIVIVMVIDLSDSLGYKLTLPILVLLLVWITSSQVDTYHELCASTESS